MSEMVWQPIETAPKDGIFLAYWPGYRTREWMHEYEPLDTYRDVEGQVLPAAMSHTGIYIIGNVAHPESKPTHWMPLPSPPHK
jgi:hypothetical protein